MDTKEEYNLLKKQLCTVIGEGAVESAETQFNHAVNETHLGYSASLLHDFLRLIELKALLANISVKEEVLSYIKFQSQCGDQRAYELKRMLEINSEEEEWK
jgi:hypothetical protein